nr:MULTISPECIES: glutamate--cysteine ligase [unclassified Pseudoalteromonas]
MKHIYRQGLAYRYGRTMQSIAGIHYNFSMADNFWPYCQQAWGEQGDLQAFKSQCYFDLIRNFCRHSWLLVYLFGASPALDDSFMGDKKTVQLDSFNKHTLGLPFATSLRMSNLGYQSEAQANLNVSYNNLDNYVDDVTAAIEKNYPDYERIGINVNGNYRQLNSNLLQIENEYYSEIRPKRVTQSGEKPIVALKERGVEYIEVRILDTNPFLPVGIDAQQIRFLDVFLLYCLLSESPELSVEESAEIKSNQQHVVQEGRNPKLMLTKNGQKIAFKEAANSLLTKLQPVADLLDQAHNERLTQVLSDNSHTHSKALSEQIAKVENSDLTPSAIMMANINNGDEFIASMLSQAKQHQAYFSERSLSSAMEAQLERETIESMQQQKLLEASDDISFEQFLARQSA